jgi:hypothetical protein
MQDPLSVMTQHIKRLEEEVRKWKNIAGIMHEAIQEGDCEGARIHYEENVSAWLQ